MFGMSGPLMWGWGGGVSAPGCNKSDVVSETGIQRKERRTGVMCSCFWFVLEELELWKMPNRMEFVLKTQRQGDVLQHQTEMARS